MRLLQSLISPYLLYAICVSHINQHARNECSVDANSSLGRCKVLFVTRHAIKVSTHMRIALSTACASLHAFFVDIIDIHTFRNNAYITVTRYVTIINLREKLQLCVFHNIYQVISKVFVFFSVKFISEINETMNNHRYN